MANFSIDVNVNLPGLAALFQLLQGHIMTILAELQAKTDELVAKVDEANGKTDKLIVIANLTKDALVALQGQAGVGVTAADIQAIIDKQSLAIASLSAQEVETDAAAVAVAPTVPAAA